MHRSLSAVYVRWPLSDLSLIRCQLFIGIGEALFGQSIALYYSIWYRKDGTLYICCGTPHSRLAQRWPNVLDCSLVLVFSQSVAYFKNLLSITDVSIYQGAFGGLIAYVESASI